jgi:hypothetical protein
LPVGVRTIRAWFEPSSGRQDPRDLASFLAAKVELEDSDKARTFNSAKLPGPDAEEYAPADGLYDAYIDPAI